MSLAFFGERFPGTVVRLEPDVAAAFHAFPPGILACVVAGTGSIVCSRDSSGGLVTSGGSGYMIDDYGSGFRLGQAMVSRWLQDPDALGCLRVRLRDALGLSEAEDLIQAVHGSATPVVNLAGAAPLLTEAAEAGHAWARDAIDEQIAPLASMTVRHVRRHHPDARDVVPGITVGLIGGVWRSPATVEIFTRRLAAAMTVEIVVTDTPPVQGALRLAGEGARGPA